MRIDNFNIVIFDLDFTIWDGCEEKIWAKRLEFPYILKDNMIKGSNELYITLQEGIYDLLCELEKRKIQMGFITRGGLKDVPSENQPPVICLHMFDIYKYFNLCKIVMHKDDGPKSIELKKVLHNKNENILYIDDNQMEVDDILENCNNIKAINRNLFKEWKDLLWIEI